MKLSGNARSVTAFLIVALLSLVALAGCAAKSSAGGSDMGAKPMGSGSTEGTSGGEMAEMTCAMCMKGAPAVEKGTATVENGVQVVRITVKDGYYSPNEITLKAGMPARLIFAGEAKDCAGRPKIEQLNKQVDFTGTGEATMELDNLTPGTYKLTCGMGSAGGNVIVE